MDPSTRITSEQAMFDPYFSEDDDDDNNHNNNNENNNNNNNVTCAISKRRPKGVRI